MAWEFNYTSDYRELLFRIKEILTGEPLATTVIRSGVGDGILHSIRTTTAGSTLQTWTVTCTNDLPPATFSVVGSTTGASSNATVGVLYDNADIRFQIEAGSVDFVAGDNFVFTVYANPLVAASAVWVMERWIGTGIRVDNYEASSIFSLSNGADQAAKPSSGTWKTITGDIVGAYWGIDFDQPIDLRRFSISNYDSVFDLSSAPQDLTVVYSDDKVTWNVDTTITGQTNWQVGELRSFLLSGTSGAHKYWRFQINSNNGGTSVVIAHLQVFDVNDRFNVGYYGDGPEMIARGPGRPDADNIYVSLRTDAYAINGPNLMIAGSVGYASGLDAFSQPSNSGEGFVDHPRIPCYDQPMKYLVVASATGFKIFARFQNITTGGWAMYLLADAIPSLYPYPLCVSGCQDADPAGLLAPTNYGYSRTDSNHRLGVHPGVYEGLVGTVSQLASPTRLYTPFNVWKQVANIKGTAFSSSSDTALITNPYQSDDSATYAGPSTQQTDEAWPMSAISILDRVTISNYGDLDGIKHIAGIHAIESLITHEGDTWMILNNIHREQENEFFAVRLS